MAILEGLGPSKRVFEDLDPGDYVFEIVEPGERGWTRKYEDDEDSDIWMGFVNFPLKVIQPEESEGRRFFHSLMYAASPEKIAMARKPYDPSTFLYQFLGDIGAGVLQNGEVTILDDYLTDGELDLDKMIGLRFSGSIRVEKGRDGKERTALTKAWPE